MLTTSALRDYVYVVGLQRLVDIIDNVDNKKLSTNIFVVE